MTVSERKVNTQLAVVGQLHSRGITDFLVDGLVCLFCFLSFFIFSLFVHFVFNSGY